LQTTQPAEPAGLPKSVPWQANSIRHFTSDILGLPSEADRQKQLERRQKAFNPHWKPGDPIII
jgi:hypothetical protein